MKSEVIDAIAGAWPQLSSMGVEHLDLFGSQARGDAKEQSDVDVLLHLRSPSLHGLVEVRDLLQAHLRRRVDVLTPGALDLRPDIPW